ncbi:MAG TPA: ion transporter [Ktedonobacterales bacterium]
MRVVAERTARRTIGVRARGLATRLAGGIRTRLGIGRPPGDPRPDPGLTPPIGERTHAWRRGFNAFVGRHQLAWDLTMAVLALLFLAVGFLEDRPAPRWQTDLLGNVDLALTLGFVVEFTLRCYAADSRRHYLTRHWIDLLALLPSLRALRFLRLGRLVYLLEVARLLRLGVLVRFLAEIHRIGNDIRWIAKRNGVHVFFALAAGVVLIGGSLVWELEHAANPEFRQFGDAVWWAFATMSTVGYGNGPSTVAGRIVAAIIMVVGVACFGVMTATVSAYFVRRVDAEVERDLMVEEFRQDATLDDVLAALRDIQARLDRLERGRTDELKDWE